jgi:hypothetical protein
MKQNTFIAIVIGLVVVCAVVVAALNLQSLLPSNNSTAGQPTANVGPVKADVLEKFDALKAKVNASGMWFGGAGMQNIKGDETAMVYIYKDSSMDPSEQLGAGFSALYSIFETEDPLLVGLVDTGQKLTSQQYKVDVYALERPFVELYAEGNTTKTELMKMAIYVTPQSESIRPNNSTAKPTVSAMPTRTRNFTPPADRQAYVTDYMNNTSYKPMSLQAGTATDGEKVVNLVLLMPDSPTNAVKYDEIETALKACTNAYGDYDRYLITLTPSDGAEYVVADTAALPAYDYGSGDISQYQLYNNMNLTYYTR